MCGNIKLSKKQIIIITTQKVICDRHPCDTVTQPTEGMRKAMLEADVEMMLGDDPTVIKLQNKAAELLGKESAFTVPSGTTTLSLPEHILRQEMK